MATNAAVQARALVGRLAVQRFRWNEFQRNHFNPEIPNPFIPSLNRARFRKPRLSLRQQAMLVKHANAAGLIHLLPPGPKTKTGGAISASPSKDDCGPPFEWLGTWHRPPVPGSDIGARLYIGRKRMFKGHKWERTRADRRSRVFARLRDMDHRVHRWRMTRVRNMRNPARATRPSKSTKLPF